MRKLSAREAGQYTGRLDRIAQILEERWKDLGMTQKQATDMAFEIDKVSSALEEESKRASVLQSDADEPYMSAHFDNSGALQGEADEPYMDLFTTGQPGTAPAESGSAVTERAEAAVEETPLTASYTDGFKWQQPIKAASAPSLQGKRYIPQVRQLRK